jgi:hypothetical protein
MLEAANKLKRRNRLRALVGCMVHGPGVHPESETGKVSPAGQTGAGNGELKGARQKGIEFWRAAVERLNQGESVRVVALSLGVDRRGLERWRDRLNSGEGYGYVGKPRTREAAR